MTMRSHDYLLCPHCGTRAWAKTMGSALQWKRWAFACVACQGRRARPSAPFTRPSSTHRAGAR